MYRPGPCWLRRRDGTSDADRRLDLPGVMSVGAAQTMLKTSGSGADGAVFVGSGPLFYLTVWQYLQAGFGVKAVVDTAPARMRPSITCWQYRLCCSRFCC